MAERAPNNPEGLGYGLLRHDIPEELVDSVLDQQRQRELFFRFSLADWKALNVRPNLRHFIAVTSFEAAPDDPFTREKVAAALLGMLSLLDEAVTNEKLEDILTGVTLPQPVQETEQTEVA